MRISTLLIAALVCGAGAPATADFPVVSRAHEVALQHLRLPGSTNGTLSFKPCATCDYQTVRVTTATQYEVNGRGFDLESFRRQLDDIGNAREETVTVLHHVESGTIEAVRVRF